MSSEAGLRHHSLISSEEKKKHYRELLAVVKQEYEDIVKSEVQRAISADEEAMARLCANYIDNVKAYTQREKVKNKYTGQDEEPDERLMRSIEEKIDIPEAAKMISVARVMNYIGALALEGRQFDYKTNERLHKALGAQAVRRSKRHHQADKPRVQCGGSKHARKDRYRERPFDQELRLLRNLLDRHSELRGFDLCARRREETNNTTSYTERCQLR